MTLTYIIPYWHSSENFKILNNNLSVLRKYSNLEIIIVESGNKPKLESYSLPGVRLQFIYSDKPFNKFWNINIGVKLSTSKNLIIGELNYFINPNDLIESVKKLDSGEFDYIQISNKSVDIDKNKSFNFNILKNGDANNLDFLEGVTIWKKDFLVDNGYFDETLFNVKNSNWLNSKKFKPNFLEFKVIRVKISNPEIPNNFYNSDNLNFEKLGKLNETDLKKFFKKNSKKNTLLNKFQ